tara:strand:- start:714 stop:1337 length:624 start_codon:yes stop_codon:yes gene_type:complete
MAPFAASAARPDSPSNRLYCYAPDDVSISEVYVEEGAVKQFTQLVRLESLQAQKIRSRAEAMKSLIEIYERPYQDGRIKQLLQTLKSEAVGAAAELSAAESKLKSTKQRFEVGTASESEIAAAKAALDVARAKKLTADTQVAHDPARTRDALDKMILARRHLDSELRFLDQFEQMLVVRAPRDGNFSIQVGIGGFVKKGDVIGVLTP